MDHRATEVEVLMRLDAEQDDLLRRLDELDQQVQVVLRQWSVGKDATSPRKEDTARMEPQER